MFSNSNYAFVAGIFASLASFFGKLLSADIELYLRFVGGIAMIACNGLVWTFFVKALHSKGGSLLATVTSAATNYIFSAVLGCLFFADEISGLWLMGTGFVISGLVLTTIDTADEPAPPQKPDNKVQ